MSDIEQTTADDKVVRIIDNVTVDVVDMDRLARANKARALLTIGDFLGHRGKTGNMIVRDKHDSDRVEINDDIEQDLINIYNELSAVYTIRTEQRQRLWEITEKSKDTLMADAIQRVANANKVMALLDIADFFGHRRSGKFLQKDGSGHYHVVEDVVIDLVRMYDELGELQTIDYVESAVGEAVDVQDEQLMHRE